MPASELQSASLLCCSIESLVEVLGSEAVESSVPSVLVSLDLDIVSLLEGLSFNCELSSVMLLSKAGGLIDVCLLNDVISTYLSVSLSLFPTPSSSFRGSSISLGG